MKMILSFALAMCLTPLAFAMTPMPESPDMPDNDSVYEEDGTYGGYCRPTRGSSNPFCSSEPEQMCGWPDDDCEWVSNAPDDEGSCVAQRFGSHNFCNGTPNKFMCESDELCRWIPAP